MTEIDLDRLVADESLRGPIVKGLRRHHLEIDIVVAARDGLESWPDPDVLDWASRQGRAVVAQDKSTMIGFAEHRMELGLPFAGLIIVPEKLPIGRAIQDIASLVARSPIEPLAGRIVYLPLDKAWRVSDVMADYATTS